MDKSEHKQQIVPPLVHLLPELKELRSTDVLLISSKDGIKGKISVENLFKIIDKQIEEKLEKANKDKESEFKEVLKTFEHRKSISFIKPFNILNNKSVEKDGEIGIIYNDGNRVRICTDSGWKTVLLDG